MDKKLEEMLSQVSSLVDSYTKKNVDTKKEKFDVDVTSITRPTLIGLTKVYESDAPLYDYFSGQRGSLRVVKSVGGEYKVIDDLGPRFETAGRTGAVPNPGLGVGQFCCSRITVNFCDKSYAVKRVCVEACLPELSMDIPFVDGRDATPDGAGNTTEYRDMLLGEAIRQAKDYLSAQGLGNAAGEPESLETLINQTTTPNIINNGGQSAFEFAIMALLAQIGLTINSHSYTSTQNDGLLVVHPLVELTMYRRASLPGLDDMYSIDANGRVRFMGYPVLADRNVFIDPVTLLTSIFFVRNAHLALIEQFDTDKEVELNEQNSPYDNCSEDCLRLYNYMTLIGRALPRLGRVINVRPMLANTIVSGHLGRLNDPNVGTTLV